LQNFAATECTDGLAVVVKFLKFLQF